MLKKLLKYEFKDTATVVPFLYIITLLFAVIAFIAEKSGIEWFKITSSVILIIIGISVVIVTFAVVIMRFYKNLYSNEGYLMFTLPVKPQLLLTSKVIVAFFWIVLSFIVSIVALCIALYVLGIGSTELSEIMSEIKKYGLEKLVYGIIPLMLISLLYLLGQIFFAITVANRPTFQNFGIAASFIVFVATYVVLKIVESIASIFVPFSIEFSLVGRVNPSLSTKNMVGYVLDSIKGIEPTTIVAGLGGYVFVVIMIFVLFYLTGRMMKKNVSLR